MSPVSTTVFLHKELQGHMNNGLGFQFMYFLFMGS